MSKLINVRLDDEYVERLEALCTRLGCNVTQLWKNLLSADEQRIRLIAEKAISLKQVSIEETITRQAKEAKKNKGKSPNN